MLGAQYPQAHKANTQCASGRPTRDLGRKLLHDGEIVDGSWVAVKKFFIEIHNDLLEAARWVKRSLVDRQVHYPV